MKIKLFLLILLNLFFVSNIQSSETPNTKEIYLTFSNSSKTDIEVEISETINNYTPLKFLLKETLMISQGQSGTSILLHNEESLAKTVSIWVKGGEKYGKIGMYLKLNLARTLTFAYDVVEEWFYCDENLPMGIFHVVAVDVQ